MFFMECVLTGVGWKILTVSAVSLAITAQKFPVSGAKIICGYFRKPTVSWKDGTTLGGKSQDYVSGK